MKLATHGVKNVSNVPWAKYLKFKIFTISGGGVKDFLFSPLVGEDFHFD